MASVTAEVAALKILVVQLFAEIAGMKESPEISQLFIDRLRERLVLMLDLAKHQTGPENEQYIDEVSETITGLLSGFDFSKDKKI